MGPSDGNKILIPTSQLTISLSLGKIEKLQNIKDTINQWREKQSWHHVFIFRKKKQHIFSEKYTVIEERTSDYKQRMLLKIENFQESDVGVNLNVQ